MRKVSRALRSVVRRPAGAAGIIIVLVLAVVAIFGPELQPHDPNAQVFGILQAPSWHHLMGTDSLGRDVFSQVISGTRESVVIGLGVAIMGGVVGTTLGVVSGFFRGRVDDIISRLIEVQWAFPELIAALVIVAVFGGGLLNLMIAISFAYIDDFARLARGEALRLRSSDFVLGDRAVGMPRWMLMLKEILPNALGPILVQATVAVGFGILGAAALNFLGLGLGSNVQTWGLILSNGQDFLQSAWWLGVFPGVCIVITVLGTNLLGRALQQSFSTPEASLL